MYQNLNLFRSANAMAAHAGARQALVAVNVANADTPGYRAQAIAPFAEAYRPSGGAPPLRTTRAGHIAGAVAAIPPARPVPAGSEPSPNGNTVSLEAEMLRSVEVGREHSRAIGIYRHALNVIRTSISR